MLIVGFLVGLLVGSIFMWHHAAMKWGFQLRFQELVLISASERDSVNQARIGELERRAAHYRDLYQSKVGQYPPTPPDQYSVN